MRRGVAYIRALIEHSGLILVSDHTTAKFAGRVSHKNRASKFICESIPGKSPSNALLVTTLPGLRAISTITCESIPESGPSFVNFVRRVTRKRVRSIHISKRSTPTMVKFWGQSKKTTRSDPIR